MLRATTWLLAASIGLVAAASIAAQTLSPFPTLAARQHRVKFSIVLGRLTAVDSMAGRSTSATRSDVVRGVQETFTVHVANGSPTVHYELVTNESSVSVTFGSAKDVTIHVDPRNGSQTVALEFIQPTRGNLELTIDDGVVPGKYSATSIWHLSLAYPDVCRRHLLPVLGVLRSDWRLAELVSAIEQSLIDAALEGQLPDHTRLDRLGAQLASRRFDERRAAERQLRELGQDAVVYLSRLDHRHLDLEQRMRVRRILMSLTGETDDSPLRVVSWLIDDKSAWLTLLSASDLKYRSVAARHLSQLIGKEVEFDPLADEAIRHAQIKRLRHVVVRR